jgi:hypothetical protein
VCSKSHFGPTVCSLRSDSSRALPPGESGSQSRRFYRVRQGWGCADGREIRAAHIVALFPLVSLPVAVAPPSLLHVQQAPSPAAVAWPFDLDDDGASVVVAKRLSAVW